MNCSSVQLLNLKKNVSVQGMERESGEEQKRLAGRSILILIKSPPNAPR